MLKRFLISILAFVTVFMYQSQSWAATQEASSVAAVVQIEHEQASLVADAAPYQMAKRMTSADMSNMMWIASIFIPGLGQILMGDLWRGLKYTLLVVGVEVVGTLAINVIGTMLVASGNLGMIGMMSTIGLVVGLVALVFYVLNIIDAYNMSLEGAGMSKIESDKFMAEAQKVLNDTFKVGSNKAEMRVLAF